MALDDGLKVRGKAIFFTRSRGRSPVAEVWACKARKIEIATRLYPDCCEWEVAAEAWCTNGDSRRSAWSAQPAEQWVGEAFALYGNLTDAPLYYSDFGAYHPRKLITAIIPALARMRDQRGLRVDGLALQLHSSLLPRIPEAFMSRIISAAHTAGLLVSMPENVAWDVLGRAGRQQSGALVERRQAQIFRGYERVAKRHGVTHTSVWFPWAGHAYHWRWLGRQRQPSDCGLWRLDWSPKPSLDLFTPTVTHFTD
jgi:GH35 family endo-1,4-beta-xylanase